MSERAKGATMLQRDGYPAGVPCWVDSGRKDARAVLDFYAGVFGWEFENQMPDGPGAYYLARLHGLDVAAIGSQETGTPDPPTWNTYVWVDDADQAAAKAKAAGGRVFMEPMDIGPAGRMAVLADPTGAAISVWQAGTHRGAQLVNAAGTWNWSDLTTPDPERAKAFYGEVFGWETTDVDFGGMPATMWRVPRYSDALEKIDPGIRERHTEGGAPEGFSDAIGWMMPADDGPPHWSVTFSVDDADAAAAKAQELGGKVLTGPYDAGPARVASLADPEGAVVTVSKYTPPEK